MEGRRRVKEQLKKLAPHDYAKTAFSYIERDTGREVWVDVPEQSDELEIDALDETIASGAADSQPEAADPMDGLGYRIDRPR